ncbi:hypothetical protein QEH56_18920 [Pelagicoccus enzymogenes]|uniref:hypothetical protein n=1 Tax=Pelagicoccus enzymogenes TaxID=2773457 RepID=UPI0028105059|nr:hypothetical protein [Pelagicoccus enzymogenes]MDQ8200243.1 hypothetical protein [Pelagicoccus enzymogenes]
MYRTIHLLCSFSTALALAFSSALSAKPKNSDLVFEDFYELEPFQVVGDEIPITVFARSGGDRRYATQFAHKVVEVAYDTLEKSPGPGLVIIGKSGEPHPITLLESFMAKAKRDGAPVELRQIANELEESVSKWREKIDFDMGDDEGEEEMPIDINKLIDAFPIPLPHMAAQLYLLAWELDFDPERFDLRLSELTADELKQQNFQEFRWIFYLPPKNTLNKVLKEVLPLAFDAGNLGPVKRALARAAIATIKPLIKDAVEGLRKGVLYWSVLSANEASFNEGDIELLASKYIESQMPRGKILGSDKTERGIEWTREQKAKNREYAKDPFVVLEPATSFDPKKFAPFFGRYGDEGHRNKRFFEKDGSYFWQEGDDDPIEYLPAGELFFVSSQKDITLQFIPGETPSYSKVELRKGRFRHTFNRLFETE